MPRKSYSTAPKKGKLKPSLQWKVVEVFYSEPALHASHLSAVLQELTDNKWRVFAITETHGNLLVSAYLSSWGAKADDDASDDAT